MSEPPTFGMWLRQRRRRHDLTQAELARRVGCAIGTLRNIEADSARPSKQLAARLASALGVAEADLAAAVAFARGTGAAPPDQPPPAPARPAPARPTPPRAGLPGHLTALIGREREVAALDALLRRPGVRLVTLTGPGGTGKTRVAVQAAGALRGSFRDGVAFVDLAATADPERVPAAIAQALGVPAVGAQPYADALAAALRDRELLLLLDNFEQVVAAGPAVADLLAACPRLRVLATSRIALGVPGEHERPIPPLALPDRERLPPVAQLSQYEAVRLFIERAGAINPQFAITGENAPAVAEICYQLDGLPLAIELVTAWVRLFQPQALLTRLDRRLTFLTDGGQGRPSRQQTMRSTIAWSHQLLSAAEQRLFARMGVFVGGATLAAAEAVCADPDGDALDGVAALVRQSLLRATPADPGEGDAEPRVRMLETIREYALEQLAASPDSAAVRRRHAEWYAALAEAAAAEWNGPAMEAAIGRQRREHDNVRAALQWACDAGDGALALRLALATWGFWRSYGSIGEGRAWLGRALALGHDPNDPAAVSARQRALHAAAWLASDQHDFATAARLLEESMALRRALGEAPDETNLLLNAARQARAAGQYRHATALLEDVLARHRAGPELAFDELVQVLRELGLVLRERGAFAQAAAAFEEALALHRAAGDRVGEAFVLLGLADIARDRGDGAGVAERCAPSLATLRELGMAWAIGFALNTLALGAAYEGDLDRAHGLIQESVALFRGLSADGSLAEVLATLGKICRARGDAAAADAALHEGLRLALRVGPRLMVAANMEGLAVVLGDRGEHGPALRLLACAAALRDQMGTPVWPADLAALEQARAQAIAALGGEAAAAVTAQARGQLPEQILAALPGAPPRAP